MTHIMLDLETWGRTPGSDIRSIGAVVFDPFGGGVCPNARENGETFYVATRNPGRSIIGSLLRRKYPLTREPETVEWWNAQSAEAQAAFANPIDLRDACWSFAYWLDQLTPIPSHANQEIRLWANDPHFDVSILDAVFRAVELPIPWHYRSPRSQKTITDAAGMTRAEIDAFEQGTKHNALDDAVTQALIVCEAYKRLGITK